MAGDNDTTIETVTFQDVREKEEKALGIKNGQKTLGIALSGGGIRSASFGLGVLQALMAHQILHRADYLSTVSGGGYIGAALTWFRKHHAGEGDRFFDDTQPFGKKDSDPSSKPDFISFLRQHGNYLFPGNGLNAISTISVLIRSLVVSALIYFFLIMVALTLLIAVTQLPFVDATVDSVLQVADPIVDRFLSSESTPDAKNETASAVQLPNWKNHSLFRFTKVVIILLPILATLLAMLFYVTLFLKRLFPRIMIEGYDLRLRLQRAEGTLMVILLFAIVLAVIPIVETTVSEGIKLLGLVGYLSGIWAASAKMRTFLGKTNLFKKEWIGSLLFRAGALFFIFCLLAVAYHVSLNFLEMPATTEAAADGYPISRFLVVALLAAAAGFLINMNDSTLGSHYRDRLMETFLPEDEAVASNHWDRAVSGDKALLETMCLEKEIVPGSEEIKIRKPYHLINTNIILFRAETKKYKNRRGDNFLLSPLFCGSEATGYRATDRFMKVDGDTISGLTLATAMSTSGAALNPHSGLSGVGPTCDRFVSFIMTFFNLRLGFWATNPDKGAPKRTPNLITPGLCSLLSCVGHREKSRFIELSDGGHFENLGIYELIRRRVDSIIVSDGSADEQFTFGDLANAIERVRSDFGAYIRFRPEHETLGSMLPSSYKDDVFAEKFDLAEKSFACGTIEYPETEQYPAKTGHIYLIKSTLLTDVPADLYGYRARHASFPDQATGDQFFDENQFDAYRELGYRAAVPLSAMLADAQKDNWLKPQKKRPSTSV